MDRSFEQLLALFTAMREDIDSEPVSMPKLDAAVAPYRVLPTAYSSPRSNP